MYLHAGMFWIYCTERKHVWDKESYSHFIHHETDIINIHNKDNLDKALLLIYIGLPHKEIEELLNDNN